MNEATSNNSQDLSKRVASAPSRVRSPDIIQILGLREGATASEINQAYQQKLQELSRYRYSEAQHQSAVVAALQMVRELIAAYSAYRH